MFAAIEPFATGHLSVDSNNEIYWETSGNPKGMPALYLHGGPGAGLSGGYRKLFDPEAFLTVSFDQRGCGRSRPLATDPSSNLETNTTQALISDIENLRKFHQIEKWIVTGGSWGTTLALAYAQAHPERVHALALAAVVTTTSEEIKWITEDIKNIFPAEWDAFATAAKAKPGQRVIDAYYDWIRHPERGVRDEAAKAWCQWEDVHVSLTPGYQPSANFQDPSYRLLFATLVIHYWKHSAFIPQGKSLLSQMSLLQDIPGVLIHGRWDVSAPLRTAWEIHKAWPQSEFIVLEKGGHGGAEMSQVLSQSISNLLLKIKRA